MRTRATMSHFYNVILAFGFYFLTIFQKFKTKVRKYGPTKYATYTFSRREYKCVFRIIFIGIIGPIEGESV